MIPWDEFIESLGSLLNYVQKIQIATFYNLLTFLPLSMKNAYIFTFLQTGWDELNVLSSSSYKTKKHAFSL